MPLRYLLTGLLGLPLLAAGYLWWTMLSPFGYSPPEALPPIAEGEHRVFVYGTLRHAPLRWVIYGRAGDPQPAILPGYRREGLDITRDASASVEGLLLRVDAEELARLDRYERLGIRYERVERHLADGQPAWVYRRLE
ncbi:gamma-glutamylcyclotransferase family protein [Halomonas sp. 328]|uniref:gamma-glutamylcyclotransferase family protein n=1 Tax=Halomonas sp. 328 TaxID=2776704 RepID=UPI0018A745B3|nr:gamma-glutamylcyclotransferase family protein [Halomonas sp. 328]MBF8221607.1 gamma-glutamylcyclotransferase [Halomonas sp. 328]